MIFLRIDLKIPNLLGGILASRMTFLEKPTLKDSVWRLAENREVALERERDQHTNIEERYDIVIH